MTPTISVQSKPVRKVVLIISIILAITLLLLYFVLTIGDQVLYEESPDGKYSVVIDSMDLKDDGSQQILITVKKVRRSRGYKPKESFWETYSNGGKSLTADEVEITWKDNCVIIEVPTSEERIYRKVFYSDIK
ncbi:MAG: hypothetical protein LBM09_00860 [Candidatus Nomurabacteria bacterium]|nr:hypothetical protein [Candidatus Nomurabacteria bacterium]